MKFSVVKSLLTLVVLLTIGSLMAQAGFFNRVRERVVHRERVLVRGSGQLLSFPRLGQRGMGCHGSTAVPYGAGCHGSSPSVSAVGAGCYGTTTPVFVPVPYPVGAPRPMPPVRK